MREEELLLACLIPSLLFLVIVDVFYFSQPASTNLLAFHSVKFSHKVRREANQEFRALRRTLVRTVMDATGILGLCLLAMYTVRIFLFGKDSLSPDELFHTYSLVVWQFICSLFHCHILEFGDREATILLYAFNLCTFSLAFSPQAQALEKYVNIGRIIGSIIFLDFRHALCINVLFTGRALHLIGDWMAVGPTAVQEVCVTICILTIPYAIERVALQWLSMLLAHTKLDEDLQAAHTVITSSSDAQGELDKDLRLLEVSSKLAHVLGSKQQDLEGQLFLGLLEKDDQERCQHVLRLAYDTAAQQGKPVPFNLNISTQKAQKALQLYICSRPSERQQGAQYYFAISQVREEEPRGEEEEEEQAAEVSGGPQGTLTEPALAAHSWATQAPSCSSLWEVKVHVDEMSLEVLGINLTLNTNHWKKSRKTFLHECILPGAWDDFRRWMQRSLRGHKGDPPFIVPFGFPRIMSAIACARDVEVKRKVGPAGRNELSLRLKQIFVRRPLAPPAVKQERAWSAQSL